MTWTLLFAPDTIKDIKKLDKTVRAQVMSALERVSMNPLPRNEGGYGKPLGNSSRSHTRLGGLFKVKFQKVGVRAIYRLKRSESEMIVEVVGVRSDCEVYQLAQQRRDRDGF